MISFKAYKLKKICVEVKELGTQEVINRSISYTGVRCKNKKKTSFSSTFAQKG